MPAHQNRSLSLPSSSQHHTCYDITHRQDTRKKPRPSPTRCPTNVRHKRQCLDRRRNDARHGQQPGMGASSSIPAGAVLDASGACRDPRVTIRCSHRKDRTDAPRPRKDIARLPSIWARVAPCSYRRNRCRDVEPRFLVRRLASVIETATRSAILPPFRLGPGRSTSEAPCDEKASCSLEELFPAMAMRQRSRHAVASHRGTRPRTARQVIAI